MYLACVARSSREPMAPALPSISASSACHSAVRSEARRFRISSRTRRRSRLPEPAACPSGTVAALRRSPAQVSSTGRRRVGRCRPTDPRHLKVAARTVRTCAAFAACGGVRASPQSSVSICSASSCKAFRSKWCLAVSMSCRQLTPLNSAGTRTRSNSGLEVWLRITTLAQRVASLKSSGCSGQPLARISFTPSLTCFSTDSSCRHCCASASCASRYSARP
mmetsp:Transcript_41278/g.90114  ORF Transcript_41278/g.90114 Transcript_41278/m.90114 type:complete len:221 (-) Transcript_41278:48-710(-)